ARVGPKDVRFCTGERRGLSADLAVDQVVRNVRCPNCLSTAPFQRAFGRGTASIYRSMRPPRSWAGSSTGPALQSAFCSAQLGADGPPDLGEDCLVISGTSERSHRTAR